MAASTRTTPRRSLHIVRRWRARAVRDPRRSSDARRSSVPSGQAIVDTGLRLSICVGPGIKGCPARREPETHGLADGDALPAGTGTVAIQDTAGSITQGTISVAVGVDRGHAAVTQQR